MTAEVIRFPHRGQCDRQCGLHSLWSIVATFNGRKLSFRHIEHLKKWEASQCTTA